MNRWMRQVFLMELRNLITYRADFWVNFFGQTFFSLIIAYFLWTSIFEFSGKTQLQGFTIQAMIFYYLVVPLIFRIQQGQGIGFISREIYDGSLNKYILYPISFYQYKISTYLSHSTFFTIQLFFMIGVYNLFFYNPEIYSFSIINSLLFLVTIFLSCAMFFFLYTLCEGLAFWFDNVWSLGVILRFVTSFFGGALIPLKFFPEDFQMALKLTPFPYLIDFPIQTLLGNYDIITFSKNLSISIVWLFFVYFCSKVMWSKGKYKYTGVGI